MLRDRAQQGRPSLCSGTGRSRPSIPILRDRAQQGRPSLCSGTGLRSQKKFLRGPVPTPMDGPSPQRQLQLRAAKGKNALVIRVHNTKISIKAAFCAAKGIVSPNHRAQSTNTAQHPTICAAKGIIQPNYRAHNEEHFTTSQQQPPAQERPITGRNNGLNQYSSPRTAYIGPELWITPTLKPKNGLLQAGKQAWSGAQTALTEKAERSKRRERGPGEFLLSPEPSPEASERSVESTDTQAQERPISGRKTRVGAEHGQH